MMDIEIASLIGMNIGNYHLEQIIEQQALGPLFLARHARTGARYFLRLVPIEPDPASRTQSRYVDRFQQLAARLEILRHPYILPILDVGQHQGFPFLVYPQVAPRTVSTRLRQSGPLDLVATGRYLDQLAAALEYASEHDIVHGALSTDSLFLQLDGRLLVADFGVYYVLQSTHPDEVTRLAYRNADSSAPELLLGQPARISSDVYAMGAVLFRLLTGFPVFLGRTPDEIARLTLSAPVPSLRQRRTDLPVELDALLAQALAKIPEQRFRRPGILANAYHQIVAPQNRSRIRFTEEDPPREPQAVQAPPWHHGEPHGEARVAAPYPPANSAPSILTPPPPPSTLIEPGIPYPALRRITPARVIVAVALVLMMVAGGTFFITSLSRGNAQATGSVHFFDRQGGYSNGLTVTASHLPAPATGSLYQAWLIDNASEQIISLGALSAHGQTYTLQYQDASGSDVNLVGAGNQVEITLEHGQSQAPLGKIVLSGTFPPDTFIHIRHLVFSYPTTPGKIGLLIGVVEQTHLLDMEAGQLGSGTLNPTNTRCTILGMIAIAEGTQGANYQPLPASCKQASVGVGDGFGLLAHASSPGSGYLDEATDHATLAKTQPDATAAIGTHADRVIVALGNIKGWVTSIDADLVGLLKNPSNVAATAQIVSLANNAYMGQSSGQNSGQSSGQGNTGQGNTANSAPASATGGALLAYAEGQLMADLPLTP